MRNANVFCFIPVILKPLLQDAQSCVENHKIGGDGGDDSIGGKKKYNN